MSLLLLMQLTLMNKHSKDWLSMKNSGGKIGLVPAAYVKQASHEELAQQQQEHQEESPATCDEVCCCCCCCVSV